MLNLNKIHTPLSFTAEIPRVHEYLDRNLTYVWHPVIDERMVPINTPCVVCCKSGESGENESRCLAFASVIRNRICWFGVMAAWHEPEELYGVVGFVPTSEVSYFFN